MEWFLSNRLTLSKILRKVKRFSSTDTNVSLTRVLKTKLIKFLPQYRFLLWGPGWPGTYSASFLLTLQSASVTDMSHQAQLYKPLDAFSPLDSRSLSHTETQLFSKPLKSNLPTSGWYQDISMCLLRTSNPTPSLLVPWESSRIVNSVLRTFQISTQCLDGMLGLACIENVCTSISSLSSVLQDVGHTNESYRQCSWLSFLYQNLSTFIVAWMKPDW